MLKYSFFLFVFISVMDFSRVVASEDVIGVGAVRSNPADYPSSCFLKISVSEFGEESEKGCSGTLIASNKILTAGHCLGEDFSLNRTQIQITCGGFRQAQVTDVQLPTTWFYRSDMGASVPRVPEDVAVVTLAQNSLQPFVPVAESKEDFFTDDDALKVGSNCYLAGFGINPNGGKGVLYTASLNHMVLTYEGGAIKLAETDGSSMKTTAQHGDSGGSLICENKDRVKTLVGSTVSIRYDKRRRNVLLNYFAPTWLNRN